MAYKATQTADGFETPPIIPLGKFLQQLGRSRTTGFRWRQKGWLNTVTIAGRPYLRREDIQTFLRRAAEGDFERADS